MKLRAGIQLFDSGQVRKAPRAWLNGGTQLAAEANLPDGIPYGEGAFIPRSDWREPTKDEAALLFRRSVPDTIGNCMGIVALPEALRAKALALDISGCNSLEEFITFSQTKACQDIKAELAEFMHRYRQSEESYLLHSLIFSPPGLPTVTMGADGRGYLGLHLDSWYALDLNTRDGAPNRISVNLGRDDRYFLFMNIPMREIVASVPEEKRVLGDVVTSFLTANPTYPVVRVRVSPGEAYIAPTENMIHDGSSEGRRSHDTHLTARGFFLPA